jgi:hypothetical protein
MQLAASHAESCCVQGALTFQVAKEKVRGCTALDSLQKGFLLQNLVNLLSWAHASSMADIDCLDVVMKCDTQHVLPCCPQDLSQAQCTGEDDNNLVAGCLLALVQKQSGGACA